MIRNRFIPLALAGTLLAGCVTTAPNLPPLSEAQKQNYKQGIAQAFSQGYSAKSVEEKEVTAFIANTLKASYETYDVGKISKALGDNFKFSQKLTAERMATDNAQGYLEGKANWLKDKRVERTATFAIQSIDIDATASNATVSTYVTYETQTFRNRTLETYKLSKSGNGWVYDEINVEPLHLAHGSLHEAEIFLFEYMDDTPADKLFALFNQGKAEQAYATLKAKEVKQLPSLPKLKGDYYASFVTVFKEPPAPNDRVNIEVLRYKTKADIPNAKRVSHRVSDTVDYSMPQYVNSGWLHFLPRNRNSGIIIKAYVNGHLVTTKVY